MADIQQLEAVVKELVELYNISAPPIPIEQMLQKPRQDMWSEVDMNYVTARFLNISTPFSPRMSLARFLARHIATSPWGEERGLRELGGDEDMIDLFARVITMPGDLVMEIAAKSRTPELISLHFEVPEDDARLRLKELASYRR